MRWEERRWLGEGGRRGGVYHKAELAPLVEEISVDIDTVRLTQILGYEGSYGGQELLFKRVLVLDVSQLCGQSRCSLFLCHILSFLSSSKLLERWNWRICRGGRTSRKRGSKRELSPSSGVSSFTCKQRERKQG